MSHGVLNAAEFGEKLFSRDVDFLIEVLESGASAPGVGVQKRGAGLSFHLRPVHPGPENTKKSQMSQSDRLENKLNAELERNGPPGNPRAVCDVCKRLYRDPKILPCLHTFCSECIGQLETFSVGGPALEERPAVTVLCPACDSEVDIPPSGPGGLSTDHLALDEVFQETLATDGPLGCDLCGEGGAESRCEVCCVSLCEFCCQAHRCGYFCFLQR